MPFNLDMMARAFPVLLQGLVVTLELSALAIVLSLIWGVALVLGRLSRSHPLRLACAGYVQLVRNTPVLVQMYFFYFGFAMAGLRLSPLQVPGMHDRCQCASVEYLYCGVC